MNPELEPPFEAIYLNGIDDFFVVIEILLIRFKSLGHNFPIYSFKSLGLVKLGENKACNILITEMRFGGPCKLTLTADDQTWQDVKYLWFLLKKALKLQGGASDLAKSRAIPTKSEKSMKDKEYSGQNNFQIDPKDWEELIGNINLYLVDVAKYIAGGLSNKDIVEIMFPGKGHANEKRVNRWISSVHKILKSSYLEERNPKKKRAILARALKEFLSKQ